MTTAIKITLLIAVYIVFAPIAVIGLGVGNFAAGVVEWSMNL